MRMLFIPETTCFRDFFSMICHSFRCILSKSTLSESRTDQRRGICMNVLEYGSPAADLVLLQPVDDHDLEGMDHEIEAIRSQLHKDFRLLAFKVEDWNRDLSPWEAPAVFGAEAFGDGAQETLDEIPTRRRHTTSADTRWQGCLHCGQPAGPTGLQVSPRPHRLSGFPALIPS